MLEGAIALSGLEETVRSLLDHYGLLALFVLLAIEEAGVWLPLPGDLLIIYFGYRVSQSPSPVIGAVPVLLTVTAGVLCGSIVLYVVARRFSWLPRRLGPVIHLSEDRLVWMEGWVRRRGSTVIIPGRLIPGLRIPTTVVSGLFAIPVAAFLPAVAVAAVIWGVFYFILGAAGTVIAEALQDVLPTEPETWILSLFGVLVLVAAIGQVRRLRAHRGQR